MQEYLDTTTIALLTIFAVEAIVFFRFYSSDGVPAVYHAWFAWVIDLLAVCSGTFLMWLALYAHHHQQFEAPASLVYALFILGSWQALIHAIKWYIRSAW